jgi:hypothetical protein
MKGTSGANAISGCLRIRAWSRSCLPPNRPPTPSFSQVCLQEVAGGEPSDADRLQPLTAILGMPRPPVRMARLIKQSESWDFKKGKRILSAARTRTMQRGQPAPVRNTVCHTDAGFPRHIARFGHLDRRINATLGADAATAARMGRRCEPGRRGSRCTRYRRRCPCQASAESWPLPRLEDDAPAAAAQLTHDLEVAQPHADPLCHRSRLPDA